MKKSLTLRALADAADALARIARAAADDEPESDALVPLEEAARLAATSRRVVRDAIRSKELPGYGRARDRSVRRADLDAWIANRRTAPLPGVDDPDMARRFHRLA